MNPLRSTFDPRTRTPWAHEPAFRGSSDTGVEVRRTRLGLAVVLLLPASLPGMTAWLPQQPVTMRVSVGLSGAQADAESLGPSLSADGRHVAFTSWATNLVASDTNAVADVFVVDREAGVIVRASLSASGAEVSGDSVAPSLSADGRRVAFVSEAADLVSGDSNKARDVFVRDLSAGVTTCVSLGAGGAPAAGASFGAAISADGRIVAFTSTAADLVAGDANGERDVFVRDLSTGAIERVSAGVGGIESDGASEAPALSADGRFVAFASTARNLAAGMPVGPSAWNVFVRDRISGTTVLASPGSGAGSASVQGWMPSISADGRWVAFESRSSSLVAGDANGLCDVYVRDLLQGVTTRVSRGPEGSEPDGASTHAVISADGRRVAFCSEAGNLVAGDANGAQDVFLHDLIAGTTVRLSAGSAAAAAEVGSLWPAISADGSWVAFPSLASDLVAADTNALADVFLRGPLP